jgi:hypothetical protein
MNIILRSGHEFLQHAFLKSPIIENLKKKKFSPLLSLRLRASTIPPCTFAIKQFNNTKLQSPFIFIINHKETANRLAMGKNVIFFFWD